MSVCVCVYVCVRAFVYVFLFLSTGNQQRNTVMNDERDKSLSETRYCLLLFIRSKLCLTAIYGKQQIAVERFTAVAAK